MSGMDNDGNGGPGRNDPGWVQIDQGDDEDGALMNAPLWVRNWIVTMMFAWQLKHLGPPTDLATFIADTAGWNIGFTLMPRPQWEEMDE